ncbi:protein kinase domain-containing protein, partial [Dapis sp. BLCC M229]|uniref:protein kinase domain-containing protein n=1 Tax=Dapis sp. BLCC M229 TaxID=3400188 RepID=UPI003CFA5D16
RHRYKILSELGKGGFGTTYLATDLDLPNNPQCVVKHLAPSDPRPKVFQIAKTLFDKEARTLQHLGEHNQIPKLLAYFEEEKQFYLVQEFVNGYDLTKEIYSGKKFSENEVVKLLIEILEVLKYVHQQNVIHRDLKPQNIMRRESDNKIVLIDFGAVKEITGLTVTTEGHTITTIAVGTPGYMPSEQAAGKPKFCSDIYAVGMIGIEALTGIKASKLPQDKSTGEIIWKNQVDVSENLGRILDKMVADYWRHRYQNIDEVINELINIDNKPLWVLRFNNFFSRISSELSEQFNNNVNNQSQSSTSQQATALIFKNVDYTKLHDLLAEKKWKQANWETNIIIQKATKIKWLVKFFGVFGCGLNSQNMKQISCTDLQTIDQLWQQYSNGKFGFSVQKQIYLDTGNNPLEFTKETYKEFAEKIGWKLKRNKGLMGGWLLYCNLIFKNKAPRGHLPVLITSKIGFWSVFCGLAFCSSIVGLFSIYSYLVLNLYYIYGGLINNLFLILKAQHKYGALIGRGIFVILVFIIFFAILLFLIWVSRIIRLNYLIRRRWYLSNSHSYFCFLSQRLDECNIEAFKSST